MRLAGKAGRPGRPPVFPGTAVPFRLMVRVLSGLPLGQATGRTVGIPAMAGLDWPVPDVSTAQGAGRGRSLFRRSPFIGPLAAARGRRTCWSAMRRKRHGSGRRAGRGRVFGVRRDRGPGGAAQAR